MSRSCFFTIALAVGLGLLGSPARAAKMQEPAPVTEEQLAYSKKLFAEGEKAMKTKDFPAALEKYKEAYRYAPHLHLFTYNIAVAAEAAGDCKTAHYYYGMFLGRVPEHPARKKVQKKVERLQQDCPYDEETSEVVSLDAREERDEERAAQEKERALQQAVSELQAANRLYSSAKNRFSDVKAFRWAAWRKGRHARRLARLADKRGVAAADDDRSEPPAIPDDARKACRLAHGQEKRTIEALEAAFEQYDDPESVRVLGRFLRAANRRDLPAFDDCAD